MKPIIALAVMLIVAGCSSQPKVGPRMVWVNGFQIPENCLYAAEQWANILPALNSPNVSSRTIHTSEGTFTVTKIAHQTYICNRSKLEVEAGYQ